MSIPIPTNTITQTITLTPGQQFVLPSGAVIETVIANGDATATSDCELPPLSEYTCSYFKITMANDAASGEPMDDATTTIGILKVGSSSFDFNDQLVYPSGVVSETVLNTYITDQGLFKFTNTTVTSLAERKVIWLYFQTVDSLLSSVELQVFDNLNPVYFKAGTTAINCGEYPNP